ncbi:MULTISPECIES: ABC transporter substrate-binding protein [Brenneria]|uniref:ABC transporter substrate-binding protein n=1 Tax=Brenneria nigrifluens DSM 30175 = ATCC 13028 TaxID=1121120 RepID=A0A2U1USH7_9GAMM|nr:MULTISPECIES: ABC transporter substrate-binding protein [Brenneria]EHD21156.1 Tat pathway signal sequence domain-containing protein 11 [Brenneria sp. EniD312]PWC24574.1 ABC transporter substrate-binding protein [Brenneria nigrifluens DSM 30175 = ATCC 13028]QCR04304.1 ABC transporter substrate-binding protein [Brenneria nigrifluens DSM 30175 = ATCC 13028]
MSDRAFLLSRRRFLASLGVAGAAAGLSAFPALGAPPAAPAQNAALTTIKLAWGQTSVCQAPISVALRQGLFEKYGLKVEPVNFSGPTDALLQAIATGKADGGIGMALRWLKPLEQGFDVTLTAGTHGGCMRLLVPKNSNIRSLADLAGKSVAVSDPASPVRNFFAIQLAKLGIDPDRQVNWLQYPADLFGEALRKGEVQAIAGEDPQSWLIKRNDQLLELSNNLQGEYANAACCVLGLRGTLVREQPDIARAITQAILDAQQWTAQHPTETGETFAPYLPSNIPAKDIATILTEHTHNHRSTGAQLRKEVALYVNDLKTINVIRPDTDAERFASHYVADILNISASAQHSHS